MSRSPPIYLAHNYWEKHVFPSDLVIDATCGNGQDTLFLSTLNPQQIVSLDIQQQALTKATQLLHTKAPQAPVEFLLQSHANLTQLRLSCPPRLIVYNLGYLPGGDKKIVTKTETTLQSLRSACEILALKGAISITCYPGHPEGKEEELAILSFFKQASSLEWRVCYHTWINRPLSPSLFWVIKEAVLPPP